MPDMPDIDDSRGHRNSAGVRAGRVIEPDPVVVAATTLADGWRLCDGALPMLIECRLED